MSNTQTIFNQENSLYKLQNDSSGIITNSFPVRRLVRNANDYDQGWITAFKSENQKYFDAVLTNKRLEQYEKEESNREKAIPKRRILKKFDFLDSSDGENPKNPHLLDGFFLLQLFCIEDPLNLSIADISGKNLNQIKEDDMALFENLVDINANENCLNFESFRHFANVQRLSIACNNIKTIRVKHEDFINLMSLDLSFNNLTPIDVAHLGILKNLKCLKLTGNNLTFLPDTFSKLYVFTKDNKKIVSEKFQSLEELFLDQNQLKEEDSFDVLSVLKKLKRLYLNQNNITSIPNLKIYRKNHVYQEFNKSYYKRKTAKESRQKSSSQSRRTFLESKSNESIVKDLDRPNSEMNIHNSNTFRNSFILEEEEEENNVEEIANLTTIDEANAKLSTISAENFDQNFELPFPELVYINLADNQIGEEDDLIAIATWPLLNEVILYGNPIVYNNVGFTPLIKQYLVERLGMNIQKIRPLKPLKVPVIVPQREHRFVDTSVPKVSKIPIETKMLTYYQEILNDQQISDRSNISSASSINFKKASSDDSFDSGGHVKNDIFKPFKNDKILSSFIEDEIREPHQEHKKAEDKKDKKDKNFNSFFMTQGDQDEAANSQEAGLKKNDDKAQQSSRVESRFKNYEILLNIENEDKIKVPKDLGASVRALKQLLEHPTTIRDPVEDLSKAQIPIRKNIKFDKLTKKPVNQPSNKLTQINQVLDDLREQNTTTETDLINVVYNEQNPEFMRAIKMLDRAQKKYDQIKQESIGRLFSPREKNNIRFNFERTRTDLNEKISEEK